MQVNCNPGHVSFLMDEGDTFFELGYKVLMKQRLAHSIPFLRVKYNGKDKLLYGTENYTRLMPLLGQMQETAVVGIIEAILRLLLDIAQNGFIPKEAVVLDTSYLFWDEKQNCIRCMILPIAGECRMGDGKNWIRRYGNLMNCIMGYLQPRIREPLERYLLQEPEPENIQYTLSVIERLRTVYFQEAASAADEKQGLPELTLSYNGPFGQFTFYITKEQFLIGKKADSVDGCITISPAVSRIHCKIMRNDKNQYGVIDMGSVNHTYLNGNEVPSNEGRLLSDGDILRLADVELQVQITEGRG